MGPDANAFTTDQLAAAAAVFGLVSLAVCWWFPFGPVLGLAGTACGLLPWWFDRDRARTLVGALLAAFGAAVGLALAWSYWLRLFGT